ncbi:MAG: alpha/beta hydrolase [Pyrinomonadaceae bacterium]|nr:alpha/beta hydrolase [Pyrinomonadaceae bacterium]
MKRVVIILSLVALAYGLFPHSARGQEEQPQSVGSFEEGYVPIPDGLRLYYRKFGSGKRVVVVPLRLFLFDDFKQLSDEFTIISFDPRNRGFSSPVQDNSKLTINEDIEDIERVRQHFRLQKFSLVGYSYMGLGVVLYAMKYPQHLERLIQLGPVPLKYGTEYPKSLTANDPQPVIDAAKLKELEELRKSGFDQSSPKEFCQQQWQLMRFNLVGNPANVEKLGRGVCDMPNEWPVNLARHFQYHFTSVQRLNISKAEVAKVSIPVLTIHGTKDRNAPYGAGREWAMMLPNACLLTIEGAAHQAFAEFPEIVFPAIRTFLKGGWPAKAERVKSLERAKA